MSRETDVELIIDYRKSIIKKHISVNTCKECVSAHMVNGKVECGEVHPTVTNCNLLKLFYNV